MVCSFPLTRIFHGITYLASFFFKTKYDECFSSSFLFHMKLYNMNGERKTMLRSENILFCVLIYYGAKFIHVAMHKPYLNTHWMGYTNRIYSCLSILYIPNRKHCLCVVIIIIIIAWTTKWKYTWQKENIGFAMGMASQRKVYVRL